MCKIPYLIKEDVNPRDRVWRLSTWDDGTQCIYHRPYEDRQYKDSPHPQVIYMIERVVKENSRRKNWCITRRTTARDMTRLYPPKVAGPFKDLEAAKAAFLMFVSASGLL